MDTAAPQSKKAVQRALLVGVSSDSAKDFEGAVASLGTPWEVFSVKSAFDGFQVLSNSSIDLVVARVWLSDTNGVDFLDAVLAKWPETTRVLLSDSALLETTVRGIGKAHHHLLEPCPPSALLDIVGRSGQFCATLANPHLPALMAKMPQLPSPPETYFQILEEVRSSDASVDKVGNLIVEDPALSAKVLQLANSAVFGLQLRVVHPAEAVAYLGLETTKALLLLAHTFSYFERVTNFSLSALQNHALTVARFARRIAEVESATQEVQSESFTAGLLHDLGKLLLAANLPEQFEQAVERSKQTPCQLWEAERDLVGASHAEVSGFLLDTWHLASPVVNAVTWHHEPQKGAGANRFTALSAVYAANLLDHQLRAEGKNGNPVEPDVPYLGAIGCTERWSDWSAACANFTS